MSERDDQLLKCRFPGQKKGENIKILVRKHWMIDIKVGAVFMILAVIPLAAYLSGLIALWPDQLNSAFWLTLLVFIVYIMVAMLISYIKWQNEELDVIIVTNERVIGHDQVDFFHKTISETNIAQVQDVKGIEKGFLGTIFHYGRLEVQTAADKIAFSIDHVPRPYQLARQILDIRDRHLDKEKFEETPDTPPPPVF